MQKDQHCSNEHISVKVKRMVHRKEWEQLESRSHQSPFQSFEIQRILQRKLLMYSVRAHSFPLYAHIYYDGKLVMIAPLFRNAKNRHMFSSMSGITGLNKYDFVYSADLSASEFSECTEKLLTVLGVQELSLLDVPAESAWIPWVKSHAEQAELVERQNVSICLGSNYDEYYSALSKHSRQNIRTAYNRLQADGHHYRFECIRGQALSGKRLNELLTLYGQRREDKYQIGNSFARKVFCRYLDFSTVYQQKYHDNCYCMLYIDDELSAFMSGIYCSETNGVLFPRLAISESFGRYSPGMIMLNECAKYFIDVLHIDTIDLSKGNEPYKSKMGGEIYPSYDITVRFHK